MRTKRAKAKSPFFFQVREIKKIRAFERVFHFAPFEILVNTLEYTYVASFSLVFKYLLLLSIITIISINDIEKRRNHWR